LGGGANNPLPHHKKIWSVTKDSNNARSFWKAFSFLKTFSGTQNSAVAFFIDQLRGSVKYT
jgi:hypothetical protein